MATVPSARVGPETQIDLSKPDNTGLDRGASLLCEALWYFFGRPIIRSTMITSSSVRRIVLRVFGATIGKNVYIKPGIRVKFPWKLTVGDNSWLGEDIWIDNLAQVTIEPNTCISQGAYLCTGNHDWASGNMKLFLGPIVCGAGSWVGAKALVCPGITIGKGAVVCAGSVVTKSVPPWEIHNGNPASFLRRRAVHNQGR